MPVSLGWKLTKNPEMLVRFGAEWDPVAGAIVCHYGSLNERKISIIPFPKTWGNEEIARVIAKLVKNMSKGYIPSAGQVKEKKVRRPRQRDWGGRLAPKGFGREQQTIGLGDIGTIPAGLLKGL